MSWTGSERQRRPQGVCSAGNTSSRVRVAPSLVSANPRFVIPCETRVRIAKDDGHAPQWRDYVTQVTLRLDNGRDFGTDEWLFQHEGYLIAVSREHVQDTQALGV